MSSFSFTVTTVAYAFTATVANPAELVLSSSPDDVNVTSSLSTVTVRTTSSQVLINVVGAAAGNPFNQSLNTGDSVTFATVTANSFVGPNGGPASFPNGVNTANTGAYFLGNLDVGYLNQNFTNLFALYNALLPLDFGTILGPSGLQIDFGPI
jgi:hypothetical protein